MRSLKTGGWKPKREREIGGGRGRGRRGDAAGSAAWNRGKTAAEQQKRPMLSDR